jgi:poly(A) polymerase
MNKMCSSEQKIIRIATGIVGKLQKNGYIAFFVGGCVRDKLLGKCIEDVDIATSALPGQIKKLFKKTYDIGAAFGIVNVVEYNINFEVASFRKEGEYKDGRRPCLIEYTVKPEEDAQRRDFTINALLYDPISEDIYDYFTGREDLNNGILKSIGDAEDRFQEDYLRILRAVRFGIKFNFKIDDNLIKNIAKYARCLEKLSAERVRDELNKIFLGPHPDRAFDLLSSTGILKVILPELEHLHGITQPEKFHPEGDVFEHTKLMLAEMALPTVELVWAILLHDVGKPCTMHIDDDGRERFFCHELKGCEIADFILKRFKMPNNIRKNVCIAVRNHMRFAHVTKMKTSKWKKLMAAETFPLELELHRLDSICSNKKMDGYLFLLDKMIECKCQPLLPDPYLNGNDLKTLRIKPGPIFSKILHEIREKQINGEIQSKLEAIRFIKKTYL